MRLRMVPRLPLTPDDPDESAATDEENAPFPGRLVADSAAVPDSSSQQPLCASDQLLARARMGWRRVTAEQALDAAESGALFIDLRTESQRAETGELPGAIVIDLTVLEWRLDPTCEHRIPEAGMLTPIVLICRQGYSSSLAVARLRAMGLRSVTDVIGGVEAWVAADLPMSTEPADVRR